jgi:UDP-glucose 4-epimerase
MTADCEYGAPINCACCRGITLNELVALINRILGKNIEPIYAEPRPGEVKHSLADISRAKVWLGYTPLVDFEEGLKLTVAVFGRSHE